jgi:hypothetical protein
MYFPTAVVRGIVGDARERGLITNRCRPSIIAVSSHTWSDIKTPDPTAYAESGEILYQKMRVRSCA